jgi:putative redox protein
MMQKKATTARAVWTGDLRFLCETGSGHAVVMAAPQNPGEESSAPTPVELVLAALAACAGVDVASILSKMKVPLHELVVAAEADRADGHPRVFKQVRLKYTVKGDVPEKKLARAIQLSAKTYCSVGVMLGASVEIEHTYQIDPSLPA